MSQLKSEKFSPLKWALLFCFAQILIAILIAPKSEGGAYFRLNQWDSFHYLDIIQQGYHIPPGQLTADDVHSNRANAGYFPAYPKIALLVAHTFSLPAPIATLITAQFFCFLFWLQLFIWLRDRQIQKDKILLLGLVISFYPASFFLITGYSESLFMAALMGFILWTDRWLAGARAQRFDRNWILAAFSGILLSSTRLVGLPLVIYPVLAKFSQLAGPLNSRFGDQLRNQVRSLISTPSQLWKILLLSFISGLGGLGYFLWCQIEFGHWDLYFKLQHLGWGNVPDFLAIFYPTSYLPMLFFEDTTTSVCRASNLFILGLFIWVIRMSWLNGTTNRTTNSTMNSTMSSTRKQFPLLSLGAIMFLISLAGKANYSMDSMVRYNLPVFVMLCLALSQSLFSPQSIPTSFPSFALSGLSKKRKILFGLGCLIAVIFQIWMIRVFTKGGWVA